jgi:ketosteroid isomerase-like protein
MSVCTMIMSTFLSLFMMVEAQSGGGSVSAEQRQSIEKSILAVHVQMKQAAEKRDVEGLYRHVLKMDNGVIIENGNIRVTRQQALDATRQGMARLQELVYTYTHKYITVVSPDTALWVADGSAAATMDDGRQITAPFAETILFVLREGEWKVLHAHRSTPAPR